MARWLETIIGAYGSCSAAHGAQLIHALRASPRGAFCGNVITDPYHFLIAVFFPVAGVCAIALGLGCARERRWPPAALVARATFASASVGLALEASVLSVHGFPIGRIWWCL